MHEGACPLIQVKLPTRSLLLALGAFVCAAVVAGQALIAPLDDVAVAVRDQLRAPTPTPQPLMQAALPLALPTAPAEPSARTAPAGPTAEPTAVAPGVVGPVTWVPILMYHYIRSMPANSPDVVGRDLSVSPQRFQEQMEWLAKNGYQSISLDQLYERIKNNRPIPARSVVLTFDDGYEDFYTEAWPVLKRYRYTATAYIINHKVGTRGYTSWSQIRQLSAAGITIGAHTLDHVDLAIVDKQAAHGQIVESKRGLEAAIGVPVNHFAYPAGRYNRDTARLVEGAGFLTAVSTNYGMRHTAGQLFLLERIRVHGAEELREFARSVSTPSG